MAAYELKYTAEEIDGILESVDEKTIYGDATQSEHGLMSTTDKSKLDSLPSSQQINTSLSGKVDKVDGKGLSSNDYTDTDKQKVSAIPSNWSYVTYTAGDGISIEGGVISATGGGGGEENVIEAMTMNGASVPVTNKTAAITETDPTVPSWAKQSNKPSYDYSEIGNTPTIPVVPTNVSAFTNDAGYLTQHQSLSDYVQKSQTAGLLKNDGSVDTTQYGTYSKPSGGIPASDLASGVIPTVPVQDVTVGGTSVVSSGTAVIPAIPDTSGLAPKIPITNHGTTDTTFTLPPDEFNVWGEVASLTITLGTISDSTVYHEYMFQFESGSTATTLSLPQNVKIIGTVEANKTYQCSIVNNIAVIGGA